MGDRASTHALAFVPEPAHGWTLHPDEVARRIAEERNKTATDGRWVAVPVINDQESER